MAAERMTSKQILRWAVGAAGLVTVGGCGGGAHRGAGPVGNGAGGGGACLAMGKGTTSVLVTAGGRVHVCADGGGDGDGAAGPGRAACWAVDLASGGLAVSDIVEEPGRGRRVEASYDHGLLCAQGYCLPRSAGGGDGGGDGDGEPTVWLAVGERIVVVIPDDGGGGGGGDRLTVFERTSRKAYAPAIQPDREDGPSASAGDPLVVGDIVFVADHDAGPHADVHAYDGAGRLLGPITDPAAAEPYSGDFELWNGTVSVISDHQVAFAEHLLTRVLVFDTRTRATTVWRRRLGPRPAACDEEIWQQYLDAAQIDYEMAAEEGAVPAACVQALAAGEGRFRSSGVARGADGGLVTLAAVAGGGLALVHLDAGGAVAREVPLAVCGP